MNDCEFDPKIEKNTNTDHSDHNSDTENCSPFCMCACCGQTFTSTIIPLFFFKNQEVKSYDVSIHQTSLISEFYISIWQPPKIS